VTARIRQLLGIALGLLSALYFVALVRGHWGGILALRWNGTTIAAALAATAVQSGMLLFEGYLWWWLLRELGVQAAVRPAVSVFAVSQFAKYLPGNVAQHVGRVVLAQDWSAGRVVLSMMIEAGTALGCGALIAAFGGLLKMTRGASDTSRVLLASAMLLLASVVAALVGRRLLGHPPRWLRRWIGTGNRIDIRLGFLVAYVAVHLASYLSMAAALSFLVRGVAGAWPPDAWALPVGVAIAWLAGYVVPGAPAGLGVREAAVTSLLGVTLGTSTAVSAALLWRLSTLATDALVFCVGLLLRRGRPVRSAPHVS